MATSPRLTRALHQQLGDELSRELLTWMGQMDSSRSELTAFRHEFTQFAAYTNQRFDSLDARFDRFEASLDAKLDAKLDLKLEALEHRMAALFARQYADLLKWSSLFWCGSVVAVTALVLAAVKK